jgi:hypothetical protein
VWCGVVWRYQCETLSSSVSPTRSFLLNRHSGDKVHQTIALLTLLADPNSLVLVSVQHSISSAPAPFSAADFVPFIGKGGAVALALAAPAAVALSVAAAEAYENFAVCGICFIATAFDESAGNESADAVGKGAGAGAATAVALIGGGRIFLVLLLIQDKVLPCETYAPSKSMGKLPRTANTSYHIMSCHVHCITKLAHKAEIIVKHF